MTLKDYQEAHWHGLGLKTVENLKEFIQGLFDRHNHQQDVLVALYKLVFPQWDCIQKIEGYPKVGNELWQFVCKLFMEFDRKHHPDVMAGGAWLNTGFSCDRALSPWEIHFNDCKVQYLPVMPAKGE